MRPTIKDKAISGVSWSFTGNFSKLGINFLVGIILARLLSPAEFGLVGMIIIFIAVSQSFIESGFSQALIRKNDCTQEDYSTVFFYNLFIGVLIYFLLYLFAGTISNFFEEPLLVSLVRVLGIVLIIDSFAIIQRTIIIKKINFKLHSMIEVIASMISGAIGITMAYYGYGVWSLVGKTIVQQLITTILLWMMNNWKPQLVFNYNSFKELFSFGSKLLISGLINAIFRNIYFVIIGRYYSAADLGFFTKAKRFEELPSENITRIIEKVSYPILSFMQDDQKKLKTGYKLIIKSTMFVSFVLMIGLASVAEPLIITLIGRQWLPLVFYLQLLCFAGMLYPLHALNLNMLKVKGRSDLFLKLEVIKKVLTVPTIIVGIIYGIEFMIMGMIINSFIAYLINSYWSGIMINYPVKEQLSDIAPSFLIAIIMGVCVYALGFLLVYDEALKVLLQVITGGLIVFSIGEIFNYKTYKEIKEILINQAKKNIKKFRDKKGAA